MAKAVKEPILLVVTSVLKAFNDAKDPTHQKPLTKDGQDHPDQRAYPFLNRDNCKTVDGLLDEMRKWLHNSERVKQSGITTGFARLEEGGDLEEVEVPDMPDPFLGEASATLAVYDQLEKQFKVSHQVPMLAKLKADYAVESGGESGGLKKRGESTLKVAGFKRKAA